MNSTSTSVEKETNIVILQGNAGVINDLEKSLKEFNLVGSFQNEEDAANLLSSNIRIDVAIISLMLPIASTKMIPYNVVHFIKDNLKQRPDLKILIFSSSAYQKITLNHLLEIGIHGYFDKSDRRLGLPNEIKFAVNTMLNNEIFLSSSVRSELER